MKVFVNKPKKTKIDYRVVTVMGLKEVDGDVGIEIECEGNKFPKNRRDNPGDALPKGWDYHKDGSLRGADNAEYVLSRPVKFEELPKKVGDLWGCLEKYGTVLDVSRRTSVHVHLNCQQFTMSRVTSFMALLYATENILAEYAGDHRVGNLFCLRAVDASGILRQAQYFITNNMSWHFPEGMHYSGVNLESLAKFGSIEVRYLRGVVSEDAILEWVELLRRVYDASARFPDPRDVCVAFSAEGPLGFLDLIYGDLTENLCKGSGMSRDQIEESLLTGIRFAQDLCYLHDWDCFATEQRDPFNRKTPRRTMDGFVINNGPDQGQTITFDN